MKKKMPNADRPAYYSVSEAAWILGVDRSQIHRAIRTGVLPAVRRRSQLVVTATALQRLLNTRRTGGAL